MLVVALRALANLVPVCEDDRLTVRAGQQAARLAHTGAVLRQGASLVARIVALRQGASLTPNTHEQHLLIVRALHIAE